MPRTKAHGHDTPTMKLARNRCFGCGKDNPEGMQLKFRLDEGRQRFVGRFRLARRYQGPPGHAHGGVIATVTAWCIESNFGVCIRTAADRDRASLAKIFEPPKITFATVEYLDFPAVSKEALRDPSYLASMRLADALAHVLRLFESDFGFGFS